MTIRLPRFGGQREYRNTFQFPGMREMIDDRDLVNKFWSIYDKAFWSDKNDPRIRVLRVTPESAEFWEGSGMIVTAVKLAAAIASGEQINLGDNEKVVGFPHGGKVAPTEPRSRVLREQVPTKSGSLLPFAESTASNSRFSCAFVKPG